MGRGISALLSISFYFIVPEGSLLLKLTSQEEPGESLSDCDKDEVESLEGECSRGDDEEESEDGFFVPDGYLSEDEVCLSS